MHLSPYTFQGSGVRAQLSGAFRSGAPKTASMWAGPFLEGAWVPLQVHLIVGRIHLFASVGLRTLPSC